MHTKCAHSLWFALLMAMGLGCGSSDGESSPVDGGATEVDAARTGFPDAGDAAAPPPEMFPELWYAVDSRLVRIELDDAGGVANLSETSISGLHVGHNALTMLDDGSLLGVRLDLDAMTSTFFHIPEPPRGAADPEVAILGIMPDSVMLEALYTDCDGRLYGMDTGEDGTNAVGNRLIRFTGDYLAGDFSYDVISDLGSADVADIDDMGPAIVDGEIVDNPGLAIDTSDVYNFNYETGTGTLAGQGGTWGIHALGGELFSDDTARLYVLSRDAELFEMNPTTYEVGPVLVTGPTDVEGFAGWSGITGPLTECDSGFVIE